jgi:non-specific serine/threonine protein kinase
MIDPVSFKPILIDFGLSEIVGENDCTLSTAGSFEYQAPEKIIPNTKLYHGVKGSISGFKADVWSLGVILFAVLFGHFPWSKKGRRDHIRQFNENPPLVFPENEFVSEHARDLLQNMLASDFSKRASTAEILAHPWLKARSKSEPQTKSEFLEMST